jgi:hypothetical protein
MVTLGAMLPTYSTRAVEPSGSATFTTWVLALLFGAVLEVAAIAVPATASASPPASAATLNLLTKSPFDISESRVAHAKISGFSERLIAGGERQPAPLKELILDNSEQPEDQDKDQ